MNAQQKQAYVQGYSESLRRRGYSIKTASPAHLKAVAQKLMAMMRPAPARDLGALQRKAVAILDGIDPKRKADLLGNLKWHKGFVMPERGVGNNLPIPVKRRFRGSNLITDNVEGATVPTIDSRIRGGYSAINFGDNVDWTR